MLNRCCISDESANCSNTTWKYSNRNAANNNSPERCVANPNSGATQGQTASKTAISSRLDIRRRRAAAPTSQAASRTWPVCSSSG